MCVWGGLLTFADGDLVAPCPILQTLDLEGVTFQVILCRRQQKKTKNKKPMK